MKNPDNKTLQAMAHTVAQYPMILDWIRECKAAELSRLPFATEHTGIYQGRCQVLTELEKLLTDARNLVV